MILNKISVLQKPLDACFENGLPQYLLDINFECLLLYLRAWGRRKESYKWLFHIFQACEV